jgi:hypothetical protein
LRASKEEPICATPRRGKLAILWQARAARGVPLHLTRGLPSTIFRALFGPAEP